MAGKIAKSFGRLVLVCAWVPFLACNLLQSGGSTGNTNNNTTGNTNDNTTDNTNDNSSTANLAVFVDPDSNFSTSDVHDSNDDIVQFDAVAKTIIWAADDTAFDAGSWDVNGVLLQGGRFTVVFGTKNGDPRAYFTETASATICDVAVQGGQVSITGTLLTVPHD
jgi:hypothetical protein